MDTSSFDASLKEKDQQIEETKGHMESACKAFKEAFAFFAKDWFPNELRRIVESQGDRTLILGKEKIHQMKEEFNSIIEDLPGIVERVVGKPGYWSHLGASPELRIPAAYDSAKDGGRTPISPAVQELLGKVGEFAAAYGYHPDHYSHIREKNLRYDLMPQWTGIMREALTTYAKWHKVLARQSAEREKVESEKKAAMARDLFDNA